MQNQPFFTPNHETVTSMAILEALICPRLFLILHLHQTTTFHQCMMKRMTLFLILHLHQTTTYGKAALLYSSCFLSCIYIKPQLVQVILPDQRVVSYLASTSNHNFWAIIKQRQPVVSYLASTSNHNSA